MPIPEPPSDPTHFRVILTDPEGSDSEDLQRLIEDCGLRVSRIEELSWREFEVELETKKPSGAARTMPDANRKVG
jgi:hypothetical protein